MQKGLIWNGLSIMSALMIGLLTLPAVASAIEAEPPGPLYRVVWPRGKKVAKVVPLAKRLDTLQGKTVCELWDWLFRGDEVFPMIEKKLSEKFPGIQIVSYKEFGSIHGKDETKAITELPSKLRQYGCDAVITSVGC